MNTIQLTKTEAIKLYNESSDTGKKYLEDKFGREAFSAKIEDTILSFEDACRFNGTDPGDVLPFTNPVTAKQRSINAYAKLVEIVEAFNQGEKKNWKDTGQYKYFPWFRMDGSSSSRLSFGDRVYDNSTTTVTSRLCLLNEKHVKIVADRFLSIYEDYMTE